MTISISGTVYTDEGVTTMGSGRTLNLSVNGAASSGSTTTASDGTYTISGITAAAGAVLTVYLQGNTEVGVTLTTSTGSNMTGVDIYQDYLSLRSDNVGLTMTNLNTGDNNGATGISSIYSSSSNLSSATTAGKGLCIQSGQTFSPSISTFTVRGNWLNRGIYNPASGVSVVLGGTGSQKITSGGSSFRSININGAGSTYTLQDALTLTTALTLTSGTLDVSGNNYSITSLGWSNSGGSFTPRSGTVTLTGGNISGSTTFNNLTLTNSVAATYPFASGTTQTINGTLNIQGNPGQLLTLRGNPDGSGWSITASGTANVSYVSVRNSTSTNPITAINSTDGGGNTNWTFVAGGGTPCLKSGVLSSPLIDSGISITGNVA